MNLQHATIISLAICADADVIKSVGNCISADLSAVGLAIVTAHSGWLGFQLKKVAFDLDGSTKVLGIGRIKRPLNNKLRI